MEINVNTGHVEIIMARLKALYEKDLGRWRGCMWKKKFGKLGLLDAKGMASFSALDEMNEAAERMRGALQNIHNIPNDLLKYEDVLDFVEWAEWHYHGRELYQYLGVVEADARRAEYLATLIIQEWGSVGGPVKSALVNIQTCSTELLRLAKTYPSKHVWEKFGNESLDYATAFLAGWEPRFLVKANPDFLLGTLPDTLVDPGARPLSLWTHEEAARGASCSWTRIGEVLFRFNVPQRYQWEVI